MKQKTEHNTANNLPITAPNMIWDDAYDDEDDDIDLSKTEIVPRARFFARMFGVFYAPIKRFENIRAHGGIVGPLLLAMLLCLAYGFLAYWYLPIEMRENYALMAARFSKDFVALMRTQLGEGNRPADLILAGFNILIGVGFGALINTLAGFLALKIAKSDISFGKLFAMFLSIATVELLGKVLSTSASAAAFTTLNVFSLAVFLPGPGAPGYYFLNTITIFTFLGALLTFIGVMTLANLSRVKTIAVALIIVLLTYGTGMALATQTSDPMMQYEIAYRMMNVSNSNGGMGGGGMMMQ